MSSRRNSRPLAIATVVGTIATAGYMYFASTQMKQKEGQASIYKEGRGPSDLRSNESDARLGSSGVRAEVQGDKKS